MIRVILLTTLLSSCATYKVEIGNPVWGSNEQEIYPIEKQ
tara:strand:+ start:354 stop:473 length:120 start_codon:yes stop_codon:yes gene_type:complete